jgi:hypothetical protein
MSAAMTKGLFAPKTVTILLFTLLSIYGPYFARVVGALVAYRQVLVLRIQSALVNKGG